MEGLVIYITYVLQLQHVQDTYVVHSPNKVDQEPPTPTLYHPNLAQCP
jgi:hypothetical protein